MKISWGNNHDWPLPQCGVRNAGAIWRGAKTYLWLHYLNLSLEYDVITNEAILCKCYLIVKVCRKVIISPKLNGVPLLI